MQWLLRFTGEDSVGPQRVAWLRRAVGLFGLLLVAATWPLWTPQTVFPQVPFFRVLLSVPAWCQWIGTAAMLAGLGGMLTAPEGRAARGALALFAAATCGMVLLDQQRFQPWAYELLLIAVVLAAAPATAAFALLRLLVISSYFYSALTKLDYAFVHTLGQQFLEALLGIMGTGAEGFSESARLGAALVFPLGELAVAVALFFPRTRRAGLVGAIAIHLLLLLILGPLGLGHKPGVLVWNAFFIVQDVLLFGLARPKPSMEPALEETPEVAEKLRAPWPITVLVAAALVLPLLAPWSWFDVWPSWGLYAAGAQRTVLQVHRRAENKLPDELRPFVEEPSDLSDPWLTLRLDRWALETLGAPIYPQNRVQLAAALAVVSELNLDTRARVVRFGLADRFTGERDVEVVSGLVQSEAAADEYHLNARPRQNVLPR